MKLLLIWLLGVPATVALLISWRFTTGLNDCALTRAGCSRPSLNNTMPAAEPPLPYYSGQHSLYGPTR